MRFKFLALVLNITILTKIFATDSSLHGVVDHLTTSKLTYSAFVDCMVAPLDNNEKSTAFNSISQSLLQQKLQRMKEEVTELYHRRIHRAGGENIFRSGALQELQKKERIAFEKEQLIQEILIRFNHFDEIFYRILDSRLDRYFRDSVNEVRSHVTLSYLSKPSPTREIGLQLSAKLLEIYRLPVLNLARSSTLKRVDPAPKHLFENIGKFFHQDFQSVWNDGEIEFMCRIGARTLRLESDLLEQFLKIAHSLNELILEKIELAEKEDKDTAAYKTDLAIREKDEVIKELQRQLEELHKTSREELEKERQLNQELKMQLEAIKTTTV